MYTCTYSCLVFNTSDAKYVYTLKMVYKGAEITYLTLDRLIFIITQSKK